MTYCRTIRVKIIAAAIKGVTAREIVNRNRDLAPNLKTVESIIVLYNLTGVYEPVRRARRRRGTIPKRQVKWLVARLQEDPELYLDEMRVELYREFGRTYALSTICDMLTRNKITRKILSVISSRRSEYERETYRKTIRYYTARQLVYLDETRKNPRTVERRHGRGPRGQRVKTRRFFTSGSGGGFSALGALSFDGMISCAVTNARGVSADTFVRQLEVHVLPHLQPFPHDRSVVVMDNAVVHHDRRVRALIESTGATLLFLPPYSYDDNPIEPAFSKVKSWVMRNRELGRSHPRRSLQHAMMSITAEDAAGYFRHCGVCRGRGAGPVLGALRVKERDGGCALGRVVFIVDFNRTPRLRQGNSTPPSTPPLTDRT